MEPFISNVANAIHGELGIALFEQDRLDLDPALARFGVGARFSWQFLSAEIVDESGSGQNVECT